MKKVTAFLPHLLISMLLVLIILVILDGYNPAMGFLNSSTSKVFYCILAAVGLYTAIRLILKEDQ